MEGLWAWPMPASIVANSFDSPPHFLEICPPLPLSLPLPFTLAFTSQGVCTSQHSVSTLLPAAPPLSLALFSSFPSPRMFSKSSKHNVDEFPDRLIFPNIFPFLHTTRSPPW
ncbi:hypothetical protein AYX13_03002 [Cryptococcus neoformans]|nr:hypothetical protein AYX13_03002 [Cryptococcus neoformans var. grubii]